VRKHTRPREPAAQTLLDVHQLARVRGGNEAPLAQAIKSLGPRV
jgi:hypothetical protein